MSLNDPISNALTIIRNGMQVRKETVDIPVSKILGEILRILKEEKYIEDFRVLKDDVQGKFKVYLKYNGKSPAITGINRISKPGLRVYQGKRKIPRVLNGLGSAIVSTSKGVMSDRSARESNTGGEIICYVW